MMLLSVSSVFANPMACNEPVPEPLESSAFADWSPGIYWCARDLDIDWSPIGNHHFLLFIGSSSMSIYPGKSAKYENGKYFMTVGAGAESSNPTNWGMIKMEVNYGADVKAVREGINPDKHVKWYRADYDIEAHKITELSTSDFQKIRGYLETYGFNQDNSKVDDYDLDDNNCASWVNTLMKAMGISYSKREDYGEFDGFDWGEEENFDTKFFTKKLYTTTLKAGETLGTKQRLYSSNGQYYLEMQDDGHLCIYKKGRSGAFWASGTYGFKKAKLSMQRDGNLVVYNGKGAPKWSSKTHPYFSSKFNARNKPVKLVMSNDGKMRLYDKSGRSVWSS